MSLSSLSVGKVGCGSPLNVACVDVGDITGLSLTSLSSKDKFEGWCAIVPAPNPCAMKHR
jgi:hypothetical protein